MKNFNNLDKFYSLLSPELQDALISGQLPEEYKEDFFYLVKLKKFKSNDNIVFNYVKYNRLFLDSLLYYLFYRNSYNNILQEELKPYFVLVDIDVENNSGNKDKLVNDGDLSLSKFNLVDVINPILEMESNVSLFDIYRYMFKLNYCNSMDEIVSLYKLDSVYDYYGLMYKILKEFPTFKSYCDYVTDEDISSFNNEADEYLRFVDYSLVVCSDLGKFTENLKSIDFGINQGPQSKRGEVNSLSNFLSHLDIDYRNSLFYHNRHHQDKGGIKRYSVIPRHKFSYKNIHMNLGSVRWYSTEVKRVTDITSRQNLFFDNYKNLSNILDNNADLSLFEKQRKIELFLHNQEKKFSNDNQTMYNINYTSDNFNFLNKKKKDLMILLSRLNTSKRNLKDPSKLWISKIVNELGVEFIADLLLSFFIEILTKENVRVNDIETPGIPSIWGFEKFGDKLVNKYIYNRYINYKTNEDISLSLYKHINDVEFIDFKEDTFNGKLGGHFVGSLIEIGLIYQDLDVKVDNSKEKEYYLRIDNDIRSNMIKSYEMFLHVPQKLPMICPPKDFIYSNNPENNVLGGFLLNDVYYTDHIFKEKKGYEQWTKLSDDNIVVSLINGLSKVAYKINVDTLEFIKLYGLEKGIITNDTNENLETFLRDPYASFNKKDRKLYRSLYSKILLEKNIISIADCFSNVDKIYFPVRLDQRTRIYCETDYFDYQKNDLAKGLISFVDAGVIKKVDVEVIKYFKGYGANMFGDGLDKKSLNSKVKWVDENKDYILDFRNNDIINKAENKACFLSFCFEYERFIEFIEDKDRTIFNTYLPIQLDASCNGYQHLALLTKETSLFDKLNLDESNHDDTPDDFYRYIVEKTNDHVLEQINILEKLKKKSDKQIKLLNSLKTLDMVRFDRSIVKKTIMTKSYNAGIIKQIEHIAANLDEHYIDSGSSNKRLVRNKYYTYKDNTTIIKREDILTFVMCLKDVLDLESPKIKELSKYLDTIVKICTKLQMSVPWTLPTGAIIRESYQKQEELSIKAFSFLKARFTFKKYVKGYFDLRKQKRSTMPNLIHSLDASTIALLYKDFSGIGGLYTVHDCFATTANNVPILMDALKSVYLKLYSSDDYLIQFDQLVKININKQFGDKVFNLEEKFVNIPIKGKTETIQYPDINKVLDIKGFEKDKLKNLTKSSYTLI